MRIETIAHYEEHTIPHNEGFGYNTYNIKVVEKFVHPETVKEKKQLFKKIVALKSRAVLLIKRYNEEVERTAVKLAKERYEQLVKDCEAYDSTPWYKRLVKGMVKPWLYEYNGHGYTIFVDDIKKELEAYMYQAELIYWLALTAPTRYCYFYTPLEKHLYDAIQKFDTIERNFIKQCKLGWKEGRGLD